MGAGRGKQRRAAALGATAGEQVVSSLVAMPDGSKQWRVGGVLGGALHRVDGPAVEYANGWKEWFVDGRKHRVGGPAVEHSNSGEEWYLDGKLHRVGGPAVEYANGHREWWVDGRQHRVDGPAVEGDGSNAWYQNNQLHRVDGPAIEYADGSGVYYWYGEEVSVEEYRKATALYRLGAVQLGIPEKVSF